MKVEPTEMPSDALTVPKEVRKTNLIEGLLMLSIEINNEFNGTAGKVVLNQISWFKFY